MAKWHYYDENGNRVGPVRGRELKELAQKGMIAPSTRVEDENGKIALAKQVTGLTFPDVTPIPTAQSVSNDLSTIIAPPPPVSHNSGQNSPPTYFYTDENGYRFAVTTEQLQALADRGEITPETPLETGTGLKGLAGQIPGVVFYGNVNPPNPFRTIEPAPEVPKGSDMRGVFLVLFGASCLVAFVGYFIWDLLIRIGLIAAGLFLVLAVISRGKSGKSILQNICGAVFVFVKQIFKIVFPLSKQATQKVSSMSKQATQQISELAKTSPEYSKSFARSFGSEMNDIGFRMFLSPILIVFIWWFTVACCMIGYIWFSSQTLQPYLQAWGNYRSAMQQYRSDMREYNRAMQKYRTDAQEYDRAIQKYRTNVQEYNRVDTIWRQYRSAMNTYERDKRVYDQDQSRYQSEVQAYQRWQTNMRQWEQMPQQQRPARPTEPRRPQESRIPEPKEPTAPNEPELREPVEPIRPVEPSEPGSPSRPTEEFPVLPILIATGIVIYVLISTRISLEFIAVNFRMEKHQRMMKTTFERYEKMSKLE